MSFGYIYRITNLTNKKQYVGKKESSVVVEDYFGSGIQITAAIKKYGVENFSREILQWCESLEELNEAEKFWIRESDSKVPKGYNLSDGGDGATLCGELNGMYGKQHTEEAINKISESLKQQYKDGIREPNHLFGEANDMYGRHHTEESKKKMSEAQKGKRLGVKLSEETKTKMSNSAKASFASGERSSKGEKNGFYGKHHTEETKKKLSESHKGKTWTEEQKLAQSIRQKEEFALGLRVARDLNGEANPMYGKHHSEEAKRKISEKNRGRKASEETKKKLSAAQKGRKHTEESIEKMRQSAKGRNKGKIFICNGENLKRIYPEQLNEYIKLGYRKGKK